MLAFSFYGATNSSKHKKKKYFRGIKKNLALVPAIYGPGWSMRLYYDLAGEDPMLQELCSLACSFPHLDLCYVRDLPGQPSTNVSSMFPMNWRFLPTLDPQVELFQSRDLDSKLSQRGAAAVAEWEEGGRAIHSMRDHPNHHFFLLGGAWGARLTDQSIRDKWSESWAKMLGVPLYGKGQEEFGPDQKLLASHVWPWAKDVATQHDSYTCHLFPNTVGFPTQRKNTTNNFVGATNGGRVWKICPKECRRRPEWEHC